MQGQGAPHKETQHGGLPATGKKRHGAPPNLTTRPLLFQGREGRRVLRRPSQHQAEPDVRAMVLRRAAVQSSANSITNGAWYNL